MTTASGYRSRRRRISAAAAKISFPALPETIAAPWSWWLAPALALGVLIPLAVAAITGNLAIPHNDSWAASKIAETFANTGTIKLVNWNEMSLIGQVVMLGPLGSSIVNQQIAVAVLALVLLFCAYDLVRPSLPTKYAGFATLLFAIWPGFALLATSFMTDVPQMAATFGSLCVGRYALKRDSPRLFYLSLLIAFWGTTIREEAILAPVAVIIYGFFTDTTRTRLKRRQLLTAAGGFVLLLLIFLGWRSGLPQANNPPVLLGAVYKVLIRVKDITPKLYYTLALGISPAVFLTARPMRWSKTSWWVAALVLLEAYNFGLTTTGNAFFTGNYLTSNGAYAAVLSGIRSVFGPAPMIALVDIAAISGALLAGTLAERWRWRRVDPVLGIFTGLTVVAFLLFAWNGLGLFDRYVVVLVPFALSLVLAQRPAQGPDAAIAHEPERRRIDRGRVVGRVLAGGSLAYLVVIGALLAANSFSFDIARWHAAQKLVRSTDVPASQIDAGLEWLGMHRRQPVIYSPTADKLNLGQEGLWQKRPTCINLATSPPPAGTNWVQISMFRYRTFLVSGSSYLYAYYTDQPGKPHRHATGCPKLR
jgi:4-amino-4-deoxy-L-arabinose transferase-like glycosyltransferase